MCYVYVVLCVYVLLCVCVCVCVVQAKRYLQKVSYYRESGFSEQSIHEAFEKAGRDWDRALDLLTQNTAS